MAQRRAQSGKRTVLSDDFRTDATLRNMAEFSRAIRENPSLFIAGSAPEDRSEGASK